MNVLCPFLKTLRKNKKKHGWLTETRPAQSQQNERPQRQHLQVTSCQPVRLRSAVQSSCLVNLRLTSGSSAGTHRVWHCCKAPWCPFKSRCSQWTVNSKWSRLIPSPPQLPTPSTTTTTTRPTLFTRSFFFFFRGPADIWTTSCHCVEKKRRVMTVCACVCVCVNLGKKKKKKKKPTVWESQLPEEPLFQRVKSCAGTEGMAWFESDHLKDTREHTHTQVLSCCRVEKT